MRGSGRGWGYAWTIRLESLLWWCCGRNKCVFITSERSTNTCFVFPIIGSKLQNASCIQIMRHPSIQEIIVKRPKQPRNGSSRTILGLPRMFWTPAPGLVGWQRNPRARPEEISSTSKPANCGLDEFSFVQGRCFLYSRCTGAPFDRPIGVLILGR